MEGLSEAKQDAAITAASELGIVAIVLYETWLRPNCGPLQPRHALWHRIDLICSDLHPNANRGKGGVSLLCKHELRATVYRHCPSSHWAIWSTAGITIAGVYLPPSIDVPEYAQILDDLTSALADAYLYRSRPQVVVGDFNAHLGALVGSYSNNRKADTRSFMTRAHLELLNTRLANHNSRFTWRSRGGKSVVDLAFVRGTPCSAFSVRAPPNPPGRAPTPHQLLIIDVAETIEEVVADPSRWSWSRSAFSNLERRDLCSTLLAPTMDSLTRLWTYVSDKIDAQLDEDDCTGAAAINRAQELIDEAYTVTCRALRCSLLGMACWNPERARRGHQAQRHVNWRELSTTSDGFFLSSVKNALKTVQPAAQADRPAPATPTVDQFASCYRDLFAAGPETPHEPFTRSRRSTSSLDETEAKVFSSGAVAHLLHRAKWKKAIGPDNMPADVFKCCAKPASHVLSRMFVLFWTHQILPSIWRQAFVVPIEKKGADLSDPAQWRGIALQSQLKKLFEVQIRKLCKKQRWTKVHVLQTGFRPKTGAIEAVYVVDELTRKYAAIGQPLSLALLDVRKAYDRTPRAFIFRKLRRRGMPEHAIGVIQALLDSCQVVLRVDGSCSDPVDVQVGVPQGDVLSPDMFNVFVDDLAERILHVGNQFGGCPKYGETDIPLVMYADDQTLLHWRADAMQAMLQEAERYAIEHQYAYNVTKCVVTHHEQNAAWPPLLLNELPIPVSEITSLLGVTLRNGLVDHDLQLEDRLVKAKRAINGLEMLGAFRTPELSVARKRLMLTAYGRSRVEYGVAIAPHTKADLKKVDSWMMEMTGKCLGGGKGSRLTMRFCGIIPAHPRMAQLRMRFLAGLRNPARITGSSPALAALVYTKAAADPDRRRRRNSSVARDPPSVLRRLVRYMPIIDAAKDLTQKYADVFKSQHNRDADYQETQVLESRARSVALCKLTWDDAAGALKLLPLQEQDYNVPHPTAYLSGAGVTLPGRWLCNLAPGNPFAGKPCTNCDGHYRVSRFHLSRCTDAAFLLGSSYCPVAHASFLCKVDNPVDAMIMDLVPKTDRQDQILIQLDKCPIPAPIRRPANGAPAPPAAQPSPSWERSRPWREDDWQARVGGISTAIAEMMRLCCRRTGDASSSQEPRSSTCSPADRARGNDRGVLSQAFPPPDYRAEGVFNARRPRASPPILPPAR